MFENSNEEMNTTELKKFSIIRTLTIKMYETNFAILKILKNSEDMHAKTVARMSILFDHMNGWVKRVESKIKNKNVCLVYSDGTFSYFPTGIELDIRKKIRSLQKK